MHDSLLLKTAVQCKSVTSTVTPSAIGLAGREQPKQVETLLKVVQSCTSQTWKCWRLWGAAANVVSEAH